MQSINTYSPFETLAFFQSVARHGSDASALQTISTALKQNEYIRENASSDASRFSIEALQVLYERYIEPESDRQDVRVNGDAGSGERSPKRRKLSISQSQNGTSTGVERVLQELVDELYLRHKDEAVREIKRDEEAFANLQAEIRNLEQQIETETKQQISNRATPLRSKTDEGDIPATEQKQSPRPGDLNQAPSKPASSILEPDAQHLNRVASNHGSSKSLQEPLRQTSDIPDADESIPSRPITILQPPKSSQTPVPAQSKPPATFPRQPPSPLPQRPAYGPVQVPPAYSPNQPAAGHTMPQIPITQQRPSVRNHQAANQGRGSPMPFQGQHPYPPYPQYPPPQWHPHMSPQPYQQHQQHSMYSPTPPFYPPLPSSRHPQTPQQVSYPPYPHTAPVHYMQQQQWLGQQWPTHSASTATTPLSRPDSGPLVSTPGSSTPWKRRQQSQLRARSPPRPEREVSPLTDRETSPLPSKVEQDIKPDVSKRRDNKPPIQKQPRRRGRPPSVTPSAVGPSRSQSIASRTSDIQSERQNTSRRGQRIKAEQPSTPMPVPSSDTEQRSSGRRGRPRSSTVTSQADGMRQPTTKRKRDSTSPVSPAKSPRPPLVAPTSRLVRQSPDPSLVIVSKNFARTSQLLLNEITSHKLAGIFAKPLSERDAPGYKDLVLRPQDLKNIKAAISKGGRAALAAIEAIEGDHEAIPTRAQPPLPSLTGAGPVGNGFYLVPKTVELIPPKGIVNSAQLEMEVVRMFANAVMFNPLPLSERGFGKNLRLRKHGGDVDPSIDPDEVPNSEASENESSSGLEGGIISDAREMFNDVVEVVGKWRELEGERMGSAADATTSRHGSFVVPATQNPESARHTSVSAGSNIGDDDAAAGESETASTPVPSAVSGPGRKRRKIAEH